MECYLCGAGNPDDADFCRSCSGQLLKIDLGAADDSAPAVDSVTPPPVPAEEPNDAAPADPDRAEPADDPSATESRIARARRSLRSVEDRRLEAALGINVGGDANDDEPADSAPILTPLPSSEIPLIGTNPSVVGHLTTDENEPGRLTYVLLMALALAVGWLGWTAVSHKAVVVEPPGSLAFGTSTLPPPPTTTTTPLRPWTGTEVEGTYASVFVDVTLFECAAADPLTTESAEALDERTVEGIVLDDHNVILGTSIVGAADIAEMRGRFGSRALATVYLHPSGAVVATTTARITRNLALQDDPEGAEQFFVTRHPETGETTAGERSIPTAAIEVTVTDQGAVSAIRAAGVDHDVATLLQIARQRAEVAEIEGAVPPVSVCDNVPFLGLATPESSEPQIGG